MTLENFEKAANLLRFAFENTLSMNADYIDELFKDNKLEDVKEEMKKLGILVFRKRHNDYFVPWHKNLYGENTIDKIQNDLISELLKDDTEYQELLHKQKKLGEELEDINSKIAFKERAVLIESRKNNTMLSIAKQVKSLKVSDEPDVIYDMDRLF